MLNVTAGPVDSTGPVLKLNQYLVPTSSVEVGTITFFNKKNNI